jgi:probable phosphoglycerate mutase
VPVTLSDDEAARQVQAKLSFKPRRIISSDLPRCLGLAQTLGRIYGLEVEADSAFREISMGRWEGFSYDELGRREPALFERWCKNWQSQAPPGGETPTQLAERVELGLRRLGPDELSLVVTHSGVIRSFEQLAGMDWPGAMAKKIDFLQCSRHEICLGHESPKA